MRAQPLLKATAIAAGCLALAISAYLCVVTLAGTSGPVGCGAGSGCDAVLSSRWATLLGVPVSALAIPVYLAGLVGVTLGAHRREGATLLAASAATVAAAACWFMFVQLVLLKAICPWCTGAHAAGLLFAAAAAGLLVATRAPTARLWPGASAGLAMVALAATLQAITAPSHPGARLATIADKGPFAALFADDRFPHLGDEAATHRIAVLFDYSCPHCRALHGALVQAMRDHPGSVHATLVPTPLNPACNPHLSSPLGDRFTDACALADAAMRVWITDPSAFTAFDEWLFAQEMPRPGAAAAAHAASLIGPDEYEGAAGEASDRLTFATQAYGHLLTLEIDRLPVIIVENGDAVEGRVNSSEELLELLQQAAEQPG